MKLKKMLLWAGGLFLAYQVLKPKTTSGQTEQNPLPPAPIPPETMAERRAHKNPTV